MGHKYDLSVIWQKKKNWLFLAVSNIKSFMVFFSNLNNNNIPLKEKENNKFIYLTNNNIRCPTVSFIALSFKYIYMLTKDRQLTWNFYLTLCQVKQIVYFEFPSFNIMPSQWKFFLWNHRKIKKQRAFKDIHKVMSFVGGSLPFVYFLH